MGFRSVPKSVTLSDLERLDGCRYTPHFKQYGSLGANCVKFTEAHTVSDENVVYAV